jgi:hypothetical protein
MPEGLHNVKDRMLQIASDGRLVGNGLDITNVCADATITVGAEATNVRAITIQLKDINGADIAERTTVRCDVMLDANGDAFAATGGSTGIAIGTDGALLALVAKKSFLLVSEADGDIDLTWTDTGTEVAFLHLMLPNGRRVVSTSLANT